MNVPTNEVMIHWIGSHGTVDSGRVSISNAFELGESTELPFIANPLDSGDSEYPGRKTSSSISRIQMLLFQYLRSLILNAAHHERGIARLPFTGSSLEGLIEQVTIGREPEGEVEITSREQARGPVDHIHVLVEWHLTEEIEFWPEQPA